MRKPRNGAVRTWFRVPGPHRFARCRRPCHRSRREQPMRGRIGLRKSTRRGDTNSSRGELSQNEIDDSKNFARSAFGV